MSEKDKDRAVAKQWLDQLRHEKRFGFPEKLENVYVLKEHFNADCF